MLSEKKYLLVVVAIIALLGLFVVGLPLDLLIFSIIFMVFVLFIKKKIFDHKIKSSRYEMAMNNLSERARLNEGKSLYFYYKYFIFPVLIFVLGFLMFIVLTPRLEFYLQKMIFKNTSQQPNFSLKEVKIVTNELASATDFERYFKEIGYIVSVEESSMVNNNSIVYRAEVAQDVENLLKNFGEVDFVSKEVKDIGSGIEIHLNNTEATVDDQVRIKVLNATEVAGLAKKVSTELEKNNYIISEVGDSSAESSARNKIIYPNKYRDYINKLKTDLARGESEEIVDDSLAEIVLILTGE